MRSAAVIVLLGLQTFHVLFLLLHDWIPLGRLNDVVAVRARIPGAKLLTATAVSSSAFVFDLLASLHYFGRSYPGWLFWWLWISYGLLFAGELRAWWMPYFLGTERAKVERYAAMFGNTHAFLPARNGIRVNTLHAILHTATVLTLATLAVVSLHR